MKTATKIPASRVFKSPVLFLAFGFGSGLAPRAPGTAGTLAVIPLYLVSGQLNLASYVALVFAVCVAGIWICGRATALLGVHDHPGVVWDEFAGFLVTMMAVSPSWPAVLAGFALFRLFDIWKPWPISWADRKLKGGLGIMLDDVLAGAVAAPLLFLLDRLVN
jgi:phosphatidylglycerophosphatase A